MVKHFDPTCPKCKQAFHVHHEDLRNAGVKLLCPYCGERFHVEEADSILEHDGRRWKPGAGARAGQ
ncbi:MAG: zinc-ribbon domain-containing protein [Burkholderiales bacterium]|nr:zinc-ribbon domain-containing protein [Burkholderiales bacterium]